MLLYTGIGDDGTSGLYGTSERYSKEHSVYHALGDVDELNSYLGLCRACTTSSLDVPGDRARFEQIIFQTQECLFIIQAELAGADKSVTREHLKTLEADIAEIAQYIETPHAFVVPGTTVLSAHFDVARTIARRAERSIASVHAVHSVSEHTLAYINRISSLLYVCARSMVSTATQTEQHPTYS